jgi:hypothetical protein
VTWPGWLGLAQPLWAELGPAQKNYAGPGPAQPKKIKKIKSTKIKKIKIYVCMNKNNVNLLVYSLTLESRIKTLV